MVLGAAPVSSIICRSKPSDSSMPVPRREGQRPPDRAVGHRRPGGEPYGQCAGPLGDLLGRHHLGGQAELERLARPGSSTGSSSSSFALAMPTSRGSVHDEPESAESPTAENAIVKLAVSATIRKSQAKANAAPAPAATPLTAATTGLGIVARVVAIGV